MTTHYLDLHEHESRALSEKRLGMLIRPVQWPKTPKWHDWDSDPNVILNGIPMCCWSDGCGKEREFKVESPFGPPDAVLACREEWWQDQREPDLVAIYDSTPEWGKYSDMRGLVRVRHLDGKLATREESTLTASDNFWSKRPASEMPDWAIRHRPTVGEVTCKRVQDVTEEEAILSGIESVAPGQDSGFIWKDYSGKATEPCQGWRNPMQSFATLFNSIHSPGSWERNPRVFVATINPHTT